MTTHIFTAETSENPSPTHRAMKNKAYVITEQEFVDACKRSDAGLPEPVASRPTHTNRLLLENEAMRAVLNQFANCDLNDENCASLEVASRRIRNLARTALAAVEKGNP